MSTTLDRIIDKKNLAWDASTFGFYILPDEVLSELRETHLPQTYEEVPSRLNDFPHLQSAMSYFHRTYLREGFGFGNIKGLTPNEFSREQQKIIYWAMCNFLGEPLPQNAQGDLIYEVRDRGRIMETGGRYSETRQGGVLHTDSVQWPNPPDILGLLCLHPAMNGGESVIVSAYAIHNKFLKDKADLLKVLYEPFPFETRRGDGEVLTIKEPIFTYDEKKGLRFRYIGTYIPKESLTAEQKKAVDEMDKLLEDRNLVVSIGTLQAGEINFLMNHKMAHGRGSEFINYPDPEKERIMIRAWLRERNV